MILPFSLSAEADAHMFALDTAENNARLAFHFVESVVYDLDQLCSLSQEERSLLSRHALSALDEAFHLTHSLVLIAAAVSSEDDKEPSLRPGLTSFLGALATHVAPAGPPLSTVAQSSLPPTPADSVTMTISVPQPQLNCTQPAIARSVSPDSIYSCQSASPPTLEHTPWHWDRVRPPTPLLPPNSSLGLSPPALPRLPHRARPRRSPSSPSFTMQPVSPVANRKASSSRLPVPSRLRAIGKAIMVSERLRRTLAGETSDYKDRTPVSRVGALAGSATREATPPPTTAPTSLPWSLATSTTPATVLSSASPSAATACEHTGGTPMAASDSECEASHSATSSSVSSDSTISFRTSDTSSSSDGVYSTCSSFSLGGSVPPARPTAATAQHTLHQFSSTPVLRSAYTAASAAASYAVTGVASRLAGLTAGSWHGANGKSGARLVAQRTVPSVWR